MTPLSPAESCLWCGDEGCGVCDPLIAEANRARWRAEGTLKPCAKCGREEDVLNLSGGVCFSCASAPAGA